MVEQEQDFSKKGEDLKNVKFAILPDAPFNFSLAGKNVKMVFITASTPTEVLTVPLGAISSSSSGVAYVVKVGENDTMTHVGVKAGVFLVMDLLK
ncbi:MAG: hypothetical protein LBP35_03005 [Candidatus Ancillula trichonymphae]|nr:hypothetical protein [Candidatus Ancillula trichonymphae]